MPHLSTGELPARSAFPLDRTGLDPVAEEPEEDLSLHFKGLTEWLDGTSSGLLLQSEVTVQGTSVYPCLPRQLLE